eukprot:scaffold132538_cov69-Phaeocystis_antarctica.AAC.2
MHPLRAYAAAVRPCMCHAYAAAHTGAIGRRSMASVSISCSTRTCVHEPGAEPSSRARIPGRSSLSFWFSSFSLSLCQHGGTLGAQVPWELAGAAALPHIGRSDGFVGDVALHPAARGRAATAHRSWW